MADAHVHAHPDVHMRHARILTDGPVGPRAELAVDQQLQQRVAGGRLGFLGMRRLQRSHEVCRMRVADRLQRVGNTGFDV
ncbi:hypothetical protein D9M69_722670 [compost metagenome]